MMSNDKSIIIIIIIIIIFYASSLSLLEDTIHLYQFLFSGHWIFLNVNENQKKSEGFWTIFKELDKNHIILTTSLSTLSKEVVCKRVLIYARKQTTYSIFS